DGAAGGLDEAVDADRLGPLLGLGEHRHDHGEGSAVASFSSGTDPSAIRSAAAAAARPARGPGASSDARAVLGIWRT
ncbi:hypothetical protein AB0E96_40240, partial [Kitasatospora sp. NPDC036755]